MTEDVHWLVGIDWATQKHHVCLLDLSGRVVGEREFSHEGTGLSDLCAWLLEQTKAAPAQIAVAIETSHGPVVEMLLERGFRAYALNPKQLDRFRDRFTVAGAKTIVAMHMCSPMHCVRTGAHSGISMSKTRW